MPRHKPKCSDQISPRLQKELHKETSQIFTIIFQRTLDPGVRVKIEAKLLQNKHHSHVSIKTGGTHDIVKHEVILTFTRYSPLTNTDSGQNIAVTFKPSTLHKKVDGLAQGQQTDVIIMDFNKAFVTVDYHKLVRKLNTWE